MNSIENIQKEQLILVTEQNMILLKSNSKFYCRAPVSPPPNNYEFFSEFSPSKKRGFGFGSGR